MKKCMLFVLMFIVGMVCAVAGALLVDAPVVVSGGLDDGEILSNVLQQVLDYLVPILVVTFLGWLEAIIRKALTLLKEKVFPDVYELLSKVTLSAVEVAEQLFEKGDNKVKLIYAQDYVQRWL
ncbi:hypothetical protein [Flexilinea flocculi]|uniref:Uncharacterized protein n=1 Tax=Flexilinea flocculi TaxID=1678840 RepID=A0A0S7BWU5_9CHLR|nr:hypothetical protein [Flexilinea flocculi]GAP41145.1 hypothetical protein ATC1_131127 [Flexilinea flocculi]